MCYLCNVKWETTVCSIFKLTYWRGGRVVDCTGLENRRTERYRGFESLSLRKKKKQTETQIYLKVCLLFLFASMPAAAQGMDKVNPSLSAAKSVNQVVTRFTLFFTPKNQGWMYFFELLR